MSPWARCARGWCCPASRGPPAADSLGRLRRRAGPQLLKTSVKRTGPFLTHLHGLLVEVPRRGGRGEGLVVGSEVICAPPCIFPVSLYTQYTGAREHGFTARGWGGLAHLVLDEQGHERLEVKVRARQRGDQPRLAQGDTVILQRHWLSLLAAIP